MATRGKRCPLLEEKLLPIDYPMCDGSEGASVTLSSGSGDSYTMVEAKEQNPL